MVAQTQKTFIMSIYHQILGVPAPPTVNREVSFTVISTNPKDTYNYGIFKTIAIAAIMVKGLEQNFKNQSFMVVELETLKPVGRWA